MSFSSLLHHEYNSIDCVAMHRTNTSKVTALCLRVFVVADVKKVICLLEKTFEEWRVIKSVP